MNEAELPFIVGEQRKNNITVLLVCAVCLLISAFVLFQYVSLDERMSQIEEMQAERLSIARNIMVKDSLARMQYDSIVRVEGKIRAAQIKELKRKGLM